MPNKTGTIEIAVGQGAKYEAAIAEMIVEIDRILKDNKRKDARIEKSHRRIRAKLDALDALTR